MTVKWLKKQYCLQIWKPPRQHFGFFEDGRNFGNPQKWQVFEIGGRTYFMLLVDRFITYTNKIGSSANDICSSNKINS